MRIIGLIGLPGSGKGEASRTARECGLEVLVMGDVIRDEAKRLGLKPTDKNLGAVATALRRDEGPNAIAMRILLRAKATGEEIVVVDGLRSQEEAECFKANAEEFQLVEICAPASARLRWLESRGRPDDPGRGYEQVAGPTGTAPRSAPGPSESGEGLEGQEGQDEQDQQDGPHGTHGTHGTSSSNCAAAALKERECRELGWGMCEAMRAADMKL